MVLSVVGVHTLVDAATMWSFLVDWSRLARGLDVVGYQGLMYALYDPGRWEAVDVLRWLKEFTEAASASPILRAELVKA